MGATALVTRCLKGRSISAALPGIEFGGTAS